jgi:hypothetical protein
MKNVFMKMTANKLISNRWPYGLELQPSANGLLLRPRLKARANWAKIFRHSRLAIVELAEVRRPANEFDAKEWQW